ncbi:MAG TPA: HNH endonuclease [Polyangiaceae bacterium]|nr:HNH endonuclease [Polyangiaceae bacterium]
MLPRLAIGALTIVAACSNAPEEQRLRRVEAAARQHHHEAETVFLRSKHLSQSWSDIEQGFQAAAQDYEKAQGQLERAIQINGRAATTSAAAAESAATAATRWRIFQQLVTIAAAVDAANLDAARAAGVRGASPANCSENMPTAAYRALLTARGIDLTGMDIDHIVPRSLGGADNPGNYRVLSASENRSLGATWNESKCIAVGEAHCARAIATSHECGTLRGIGF